MDNNEEFKTQQNPEIHDGEGDSEYIEIALINDETGEEFTTFQLEKQYYSYLMAIAKDNNMSFEEYFAKLIDQIAKEYEEEGDN